MAETRLSVFQLMSMAKNLVEELSNFNSNTIPISGAKVQEYLHVIEKMKEEYFEQGRNGILDKIAEAVKKIQTFIERTSEISSVINVDISDCIDGKQDELQALGKNMIANFINAATEVINKTTNNINTSIETISEITEEISNLPTTLGSKLLTMNAKVISEFINYVQELLEKLPDELLNIVTETSNFVQYLPSELLICVKGAIETAETGTNDILKNTASSIGTKFGNAVIDYLLS